MTDTPAMPPSDSRSCSPEYRSRPDPRLASALNSLQAIDDAMAYRVARLKQPCAQCTDHQDCPEHAADKQLLDVYMNTYEAEITAAFSEIGTEALEQAMTPQEETPTIGRLGNAIIARMRQATQNGAASAHRNAAPARPVQRIRKLLRRPQTDRQPSPKGHLPGTPDPRHNPTSPARSRPGQTASGSAPSARHEAGT